MSLLIKHSTVFEACRHADFEVLSGLLSDKWDNKERRAASLRDIRPGTVYREHKTGLTPLLMASKSTHNSDLVCLLLDCGADIAEEGMHRETALHLSARQGREDVLLKLLRRLDARDDPEFKDRLVNKRDAEGSSPLMCALFAGDIPCMRMLREHGANLDQRNYRGQTPLVKAVCFRNQRVLDWLLTAGVDTLLRDKEDRNATDYAQERQLLGMVEKISGKTLTDELDQWVDEKAHLTSPVRREESLPGAWDAPPKESMAQQMMRRYKEDEQQAAFENRFTAGGPGATGSVSFDQDYSYTPPPAEYDPSTDPWALHSQEKLAAAWKEFTDYENDCPYWFNELTSESQYWRPWCLGGPEEPLSTDVADTKVALFKATLNFGGGGGGGGEGKASEEGGNAAAPDGASGI